MIRQAMLASALALGASIFLGACTKAILVTPEAKNVKVVTLAQKKHCEFVKTVSASQLIGPDKKGDAMKMALNEAAAAGGNAFYVLSAAAEGGIKGTVVTGEALRCKF